MKKLLRSAFLATVVAFAATASADQPSVTVGEGAFGCCCAWTQWARLCPVDFLTFWSMVDDVCVYLDARGNIVGFCAGDPNGAYIFRGMTWPELADFFARSFGIAPTVGSMVDLFCGIDRTRWPPSR
jgi:hypothetical protein